MDNCVVAENKAGTGSLGWGGGAGGGIRNDGVCALKNCQVFDNRSGGGGGTFPVAGFGGYGGSGGGVYNSGSLAMVRCTVSGNGCGQASDGGVIGGSVILFPPPGSRGGLGGNGGGIYNAGELSLEFCTLSTNMSSSGGQGGSSYGSGGNGGDGGDGGAIFNAGNLYLNTCTLSGNACGNGGNGGNGTLYSAGNGGVGGSGGAIFNGGSLDVVSCTIVSNAAGLGGNGGSGGYLYDSTAAPPSGGQGGGGGGIFNSGTNVSIVANTLAGLNEASSGGLPGTNILNFGNPQTPEVGNAGANGTGPDLNGDFGSRGFNLIGKVDGSSGFVNGVGADQVGSMAAPIDPLIGPLRMNGGPTPTHALLPGSPAVDKGDSFGIHEDQRGYPRPYNFRGIPNAAGGDGSDIGAFELQREDVRRDRD